MDNCIFCKIAKKEIPGNIVYEDDLIIAFHDLNPQAPVHVLIIPKEHIASLDEVTTDHKEVMGWLMAKVKDIASELGLENGYRLVSIAEDGLQTVKNSFHLRKEDAIPS